MPTNALRFLAVVFGILGGLTELYLAVGAVSAPTMSVTRGASIVLVAIAIVVSAAVMLRIQDISLPAAFMILATSIFHNFIEVKHYEFIPVAFIGIATLLAFAVDAQSPDRTAT